MASESIVAVFSTAEHAEAVISDLVAAGVPSSSIQHYARDAADTGLGHSDVDTTKPAGGFWAWLTGQDSTHEHHDAYDQSVSSGRTVVTVISDGSNADEIYAMLERHDPVDLDEHSATHEAGMSTAAPLVGAAAATTATTATTTTTTGLGATAADAPTFAARTASPMDTTRTGNTEEVISLSEEALQVGKRQIDRGTTRVRRYVVERPVDEQIKLRDETVSVFRRPATSTTTVADAFRDREITVNESSEEAVVAKTAHVVEEVVVQKGVQERVETIHDTVRREEVEIDGPAGRAVDANGTVAPKTNPSI